MNSYHVDDRFGECRAKSRAVSPMKRPKLFQRRDVRKIVYVAIIGPDRMDSRGLHSIINDPIDSVFHSSGLRERRETCLLRFVQPEFRPPYVTKTDSPVEGPAELVSFWLLSMRAIVRPSSGAVASGRRAHVRPVASLDTPTLGKSLATYLTRVAKLSTR